MKAYKRTTIMVAYRIRCLRASKLTEQAIANKLGLSKTAVHKVLSGQTTLEKQHRIADRMAYFGLLNNTGNTRTVVVKWRGEQLSYDQETIHTRSLHASDPLAILLAHERFAGRGSVLDEVPERIDTPTPQEFTVRTDTWHEFVQEKFKGNERAAGYLCRDDGGSVLATEGTQTSSYAVRDQRYDWGYPFRDTVAERGYVAALSIARRRARARLGRAFLLALETGHIKRPSTCANAQYANTSTTNESIIKDDVNERKHLSTEEQEVQRDD